MNKEISNQKIEVEEGIELNDKDYINDLLATLKMYGERLRSSTYGSK